MTRWAAARERRLRVIFWVGVALSSGAFWSVLYALLAIAATFERVALLPPSEKASTLADGISSAMNCAALGFLVTSVGLALVIATGVRLGRLKREQAQKPPAEV